MFLKPPSLAETLEVPSGLMFDYPDALHLGIMQGAALVPPEEEPEESDALAAALMDQIWDPLEPDDDE